MIVDFNNLILLAIAALTAFSSIMAYITRKQMAQVHEATNSMKDQLVKATADASFAEGANKERVIAEHKAEVIAAATIPHPIPVEVINPETAPAKVEVINPELVKKEE